MTRSTTPKKPTVGGELVLLIGLLYHGSLQHDGLVLRNICKDALRRAHKIHGMVSK